MWVAIETMIRIPFAWSHAKAEKSWLEIEKLIKPNKEWKWCCECDRRRRWSVDVRMSTSSVVNKSDSEICLFDVSFLCVGCALRMNDWDELNLARHFTFSEFFCFSFDSLFVRRKKNKITRIDYNAECNTYLFDFCNNYLASFHCKKSSE